MSAVVREMQAPSTSVALAEVSELIRGVTYSKSDARAEPSDGFLPMLRATNIQEGRLVIDDDLIYIAQQNISPRQLLREGDIVVATSSGSKHLVGKSGRLNTKWQGAFGAFCAVVRPNANVEARYLALFLQSPAYWRQVAAKALGVNINNLRRGDLESLRLPLPSFDKQRHIVAEIEKQFSRLDEAVANLQRVKANLKRYKAALLSEAVTGRLVSSGVAHIGRGRDSFDSGEQLAIQMLNVRRGHASHRAQLCATTMAAPSGLPVGWGWADVDAVCEQIVDCPHSTARFQERGHPCIDTTWMALDGLVVERARFVDDDTYLARIARLKPEAGDIVFAREGTIGTAIVVPQGMFPCLGQRVMLLRASKYYSNRFLMHALQSDLVKAQYRAQALGSTVAHINVRDVKRLCVPVPSLTEQHRIVAEVDRRLSIVREVEAEVDANLKRAQALRQAVLHSAFATTATRETMR